jgi:hypothetical protein
LPEADGRANAQRVQHHLQQAVNRKDRNLRALQASIAEPAKGKSLQAFPHAMPTGLYSQDDIVQASALPV